MNRLNERVQQAFEVFPCSSYPDLFVEINEQAKLLCLPYRLNSVLYTQLGEDVADMAFDSVDDNHQFLRNLQVGCSACQQLQDLQFSLTQWLWQLVGLSRYMGLALLLKSSKQCVEIGSWPVLAVPLAQLIEQSLHRSSFVHKATNVALRLG